jgi:hypothetical protein
MAPRQSDHSKARRAAALKENLKRRKTQARAKAAIAPEGTAPSARELGTKHRPSLESAPATGPKSAAKAE